MKNKKAEKQSKKEAQEILSKLKKVVSKPASLLKPTDQFWDGEPLQKAEIRMRNYHELMVKIQSLIKLCVFTLDGKGSYLTSSLFSQYTNANTEDRNTSVCVVLELILTMLPKIEMVCYDEILEMLSEIKNDNEPKT